ncbi:ATP-binding cassette domain-containing protein, partial [Klebsiella pneumoniae]
MSLISMHGAWLSFSDAPLLDNAELHIEDNERVCLVGRNGAGKSTLMKILNREQGLDDGRIIYEQDLIVARLQQDPPRNVAGTVYDFVAEGIAEQAAYLKAYHDVSHQVMTEPSDKNLNELARLQEQLDNLGLWQLDSRINEVIEQLGLDANAQLASLSGGWLRKAALGRALVSGPRVLLLDEPTNHLDIETIDWLEGFLKTFKGTIIFISHDRSFIRNMATRIVDLDRGKLVTYPGNYDQYLLDKEEALRVEELQNAEFDRKLAQEEVWIRQGIKARRTRNEGRVRALKAMRRERGERREVMGSAKMQVEEASRSGKIVFEMENVNYQVDGKVLVKDFSAQIQRGDKIALIGPNGAGKTTVFNCLTGFYRATGGSIVLRAREKVTDVIQVLGQKLHPDDFLHPAQLGRRIYYKMFGGTHLVNRAGLARTFQNIRLFREMSVIENLLVAQHTQVNRHLLAGILNTRGYRQAESQALDRAFYWLEVVEMVDCANRLAGTLSYGQQRRLEIAR